MACTSLSGIPCACNIFIIFPMCIELKAFLKSMKVITADWLWVFTPSMYAKYWRYCRSLCSEFVLIFPKF